MKDEDWGLEFGFACVDCRYWDSDVPSEDPMAETSGDCHRYPRTRRKKSHQWCGEFELDPEDRQRFEAQK